MSPLDNSDLDDVIEQFDASEEELLANTHPIERDQDEPRRLIRLGADFALNVSECIDALRADPTLFRRNGRLVTIVHDEETNTDEAGRPVTVKTPRVYQLTKSALRAKLSRVATFEKHTEKHGWRETPPPEDLASTVIDVGEWPGIPSLTGIITTPALRPDGTIINQPGYDAATGYFYDPARSFPEAPVAPTRADAERALKALQEPFEQFPVAGNAASKALPIAVILTMVGRPAIKGAVPAMLFTASTAGSGKSLQSQCASIIGQGRELPVATWSDDPKEVEKMLGAFALNGAPAILFDNVNAEFGCGPLDKVVTCADTTSMRVLGKSEQLELKWRAIVIANGNNVAVKSDTARRTLVQRLEPMRENPEDRDRTDFRIPNLKLWCGENHPRLVVEALTLLRAYILAARPDMGLKTWGSFEEWTALVANAIVWAGGPNILEARVKESGEEDETTAALRIVMREWPRLGERGSTIKGALALLYPRGQLDSNAPPDGYDDLRGALETLAPSDKAGYPPDAQKLGKAFRSVRKRVVGGAYLENVEANGKNVARWAVRSVS